MAATGIDLDALRSQRWFGARERPAVAARVVDRTLPGSALPLELVEVLFSHGAPERYALVRGDGGFDAFATPGPARALLSAVRDSATLGTERGGSIQCSGSPALSRLPVAATEPPRPLAGEQSNSSVLYGKALVLKLFRRVAAGIQPEIEMGRFLTDQVSFDHAAALAGTVEYRDPDGHRAALAVVHSFVPNRGDAWRTMLERLAHVLDGAPTTPTLAPARRLGEVTGALHVALARGSDDPDFVPEATSVGDTTAWAAGVEHEVRRALTALGEAATGRPAGGGGMGRLVGALKTRVHGDYHLGQVLETAEGDAADFVVIDFEGEPAKPLAERRAKQSPLRDVAGMVRSLDYARHAALRAGDHTDPRRQARAAAWHDAARRTFVEAYLTTVRRDNPRLLPASDADVAASLGELEREKAAYEVLYELNHRPDWVPIPLAALRRSVAFASDTRH